MNNIFQKHDNMQSITGEQASLIVLGICVKYSLCISKDVIKHIDSMVQLLADAVRFYSILEFLN